MQDGGGDTVAEQVRAYIGLGSNLGDREATLSEALRALASTGFVRILNISSLYETDPMGPPPQGPYLNAAAGIETELGPTALLGELQRLEVSAGRVREGVARWSARTLDVDLLLYGDQTVDEPRLQVPHPHLRERAFVMEPLGEIAPSVVHPTSGKTLGEHAALVREPAAVRLFPSASWQRLLADELKEEPSSEGSTHSAEGEQGGDSDGDRSS